MNISGGNNVEKLDDNNYDTWRLQMRSVLVYNDLWEYSSGKIEKPKEENNVSEWEKKDSKALALILLGVKENQLSYVNKAKTSIEAWKNLEEIHSSKGPKKKVLLYKQLFQMKKGQNQPMSEHIRDFQQKVDKLEETGLELPKELLSIMLLNTLPDSYDNFCIAMETRDDLPSISLLKVKLLEEENRRNSQNDDIEQNSALLLNEKKPYQHNYNKKGEPKFKEKKREVSRQINYRNQSARFGGDCFYCGKRGHKAAECRNKKNSKETAMTTTSDTSFTNEWFLDSGASAHMCNDNQKFIKWNDRKFSTIQTAGKNTMKAHGSGIVVLNLITGNGEKCRIRLNNVIYVPNLKHNLISVPKVTENGFVVIFQNKEAIVKDKNGLILYKAYKRNNLFVVKEKNEIVMLTKQSMYNNVLKWHQRFGHVNFKDLQKLKNENLVNGLPEMSCKSHDIKCITCSKGKMTQTSYIPSKNQESEILNIIHSDICGPFRTTSLGGSRYFVTFIDGKSRYMEVKFLKNRSEVLEAFIGYLQSVERQTGKKLKILRTDNAKEYKSKEFNNFLQKHGIKHQFSVEYTPQQNGIAERANRTLLDMARCMLIESNLPEYLWAEAVNTATFIRNRCPTSAVNNKTPYEVWTGRKPQVGYLKTFGSKAVTLDKRPGKSKLEPRGKELTLVGYSSESKAYRLFDTEKRIIVKSKDVKIFENVNPKNYLWFDIITPNAEGIEKTRNPTDGEQKREENKEINILSINEKENEREEEKYKAQTEDENFEISSNEYETPEEEADEEISSQFLGFSDADKSDEEVDKLQQLINEDVKSTNKPQRGRPKIIRTGKRGRPRIIREEVNFAKNEIQNNPLSFEEAISRHDRDKWIEAMETELSSLNKNKTWTLVNRPAGKIILTNRWVFTIKTKIDGSIDRYKARLVARGCEQRYGIDYEEIFAPVVRYETIRLLLAMCAEKKMFIHQMDVVTAYVQGNLLDEIYMEQPKYPDSNGTDDRVCKLLKPLYGLKQAGRQWHLKLSEHLKSQGMKQSTVDQCLYTKHIDGKTIIIATYVDDLILASNCEELLENTKKLLQSKFDMKDMGEIHDILGISIKRDCHTGKIELDQKHYIEKLLKNFKMESANPVFTPLESGFKSYNMNSTCASEEEIEEMKQKPYRELVGSLVYLSNTTRPDISFAANVLSRYCNNPKKIHWTAAKRVLRYLKGTMEYKIIYKHTGKDPYCYTDSDWASDSSDRRSYSGYLLKMANGPVSWKSKKQKTVALSTMEAEYMALSEATKEVIYIQELLKEMDGDKHSRLATKVFCDNQSAIQLAKDSRFHDRSKHIHIRYHFCREKQTQGAIDVKYIPTEGMAADILTKALPKGKHIKCIELLNLN